MATTGEKGGLFKYKKGKQVLYMAKRVTKKAKVKSPVTTAGNHPTTPKAILKAYAEYRKAHPLLFPNREAQAKSQLKRRGEQLAANKPNRTRTEQTLKNLLLEKSAKTPKPEVKNKRLNKRRAIRPGNLRVSQKIGKDKNRGRGKKGKR